MHRAVTAIVSLAIAGIGAFACKQGDATPKRSAAAASSGSASAAVPPMNPATLAQVGQLAGQPLYVALCKPCHGADAKGYAADHAPSLINPTFLESATDDFLRRSIRAGRPDRKSVV